MNRLEQLRAIHAFITHEIELELGPRLPHGAEHPLLVAVAGLYQVDPEHILGGGRSHRVTRARHSLAWLLHRDGMSHQEIADSLGYTDAGTVRYALRQIAARHGIRTLLLALPGVAQHPHTGAAERDDQGP